MLDKIGGRKTIVAVIVFITGLIVTHLKGDVPPNLLQLLSIVFGAFVVGNVGEYVSGAYQAKALVPAPDAANGEALKAEVDTIKSSMEELKVIAQKNTEGTAVVQQALSLIIEKYGIAK